MIYRPLPRFDNKKSPSRHLGPAMSNGTSPTQTTEAWDRLDDTKSQSICFGLAPFQKAEPSPEATRSYVISVTIDINAPPQCGGRCFALMTLSPENCSGLVGPNRSYIESG